MKTVIKFISAKLGLFPPLQSFYHTKRKQRIFEREFKQFTQLALKTTPRFNLNKEDKYPCLNDKTLQMGFDEHYVYHLAWATRILSKTNPEYHVDISSFIYFPAMLSAFFPVKFYDYRPAKLYLENLTSEHADLLALPFEDNSIKSLSCMHTVEHIGLGRYGDALDYDGVKAIKELKRVLAVGGVLIFVVPVGKPKIMFNAHRIYSYKQIVNYFSELQLKEFALIPDNTKDKGLVRNATEEMADAQNYGCGCFWFKK